jgi:hypothetical protein
MNRGFKMTIFRKSALAAAGVAVLVTTPMPLAAADMAVAASAHASPGVEVGAASDYHRGWRRNRRLDVDAGDVIIGIGIIAAIAAIADAGKKNDQRDRRRDDEPDYRERDDSGYEPAPTGASDDLGSAVTACSNAAERSTGNGARVGEIRSVTRDGAGWRVEGDVDQDSFTCAATNGQVDYIRINDREI